ncbi:MAG: GIY-YIG nuclease family protein [Proteobacteria bacterium]|nr:GIY-YIG nuclease family protein [Pseudomonadota bacterium]
MCTQDATQLSASAGVYVLLLRLAGPAVLPTRFSGALPSGVYAYAGSAHGPGGVRARCRRHLASTKKLRWHIDWLTTVADRWALGFSLADKPDLVECDLVDSLLAQGGTIPIAGFGSSDCRRCASHLVAIDLDWSAAAHARLHAQLLEDLR